MSDPRIVNLAKVIVDYSTRIHPGDQVFITTTPVGHAAGARGLPAGATARRRTHAAGGTARHGADLLR